MKFCVGAFVSAGGKRLCEPGSTFKKECNTCWCSSDGHNFACTLLECNWKAPRDKRGGRRGGSV